MACLCFNACNTNCHHWTASHRNHTPATQLAASLISANCLGWVLMPPPRTHPAAAVAELLAAVARGLGNFSAAVAMHADVRVHGATSYCIAYVSLGSITGVLASVSTTGNPSAWAMHCRPPAPSGKLRRHHSPAPQLAKPGSRPGCQQVKCLGWQPATRGESGNVCRRVRTSGAGTSRKCVGHWGMGAPAQGLRTDLDL